MSYVHNVERRESMPHLLHIFYDLSEGYFASPNADYLPKIPQNSDRMFSIFDGLYPRYAYDDWFYLALVPTQIRYDLPLFECLAPLACRVERLDTPKGTGYRLKEDLIRKWTALETIAAQIQKKLLRRIPGTYLETLVPPYPSSMGFWRIWPTRSTALLAIRLSRAVFTQRFAFISWLYMGEAKRERTVWADLAEDLSEPVPISVCNSFQTSWICDFTVPRIGAFVDIGGRHMQEAGRQWHVEIPTFIEFGIPLWFAYQKSPSPAPWLSDHSLNEYRRHMPAIHSVRVLETITELARTTNSNPRGVAVQGSSESTEPVEDKSVSRMYGYVRQYANKPPTRAFVRRRDSETSVYALQFPNGPTGHADVTVLSESAQSHTDVEFSTLQFRYRQTPSDSYDSFMEREVQTATRLMTTETPEETRKRLARESLNASQPIPDEKGAVVYAWITEGGKQTRTRVNIEDIPELWRRTTPGQRVYNSFRDEYDILEKEEISEEPQTYRDESRRARSASPTPHGDRSARIRTPPPSTRNMDQMPKIPVAEDDLLPIARSDLLDESESLGGTNPLQDTARELLDTNRLQTEIFAPVIPEDMETLLRARFGFQRPSDRWEAQSAEGRKWVDERKISKLFRTLGQWDKDDDARDFDISTDRLAPLADFVASISNGSAPPPELSDLSPSNASLANETMYNKVAVSRYEKADNVYWYMMHKTHDSLIRTTSDYRISTESATNILHLKRTGSAETTDTIIHFLLQRGMRFCLNVHTDVSRLIYLDTTPVTTIGRRPTGIGIKPFGIELGARDYRIYMKIRDELLRGPAGPMALREGGILWRLAMKVQNIDRPLRELMEEECTHMSIHMKKHEMDGKAYVETLLSQQDQYIIVGVYRVLQGKRELQFKCL